ncbi:MULTISPECIES: nuclear transport factor 2 family protein [Mycetocola]|uniref:Nuclear transport factor 2 family protein n=1 Tax=Mycetocola lacteus TaxID=76637 RepID=A0A3L7AR02_9MICO|nr:MULTISPECIES: nuclear transport factor 2 family protein [Mycetocola]MCS4275321.1 hypothetical protein [Mycetocola sp. BIGb0189]RLP82896.1 nuclear transport factor 2 family protein [Mycetocola lacteus]
MTPTLPEPIARFIDTTNAQDSAGFVAAFTEDALLDDWGRVFRGAGGIADWNRTDNIGVNAHFDLVSVEQAPAGEEWIVTLRVSGDGYNGTGPMRFQLAGDRISRLRITPN